MLQYDIANSERLRPFSQVFSKPVAELQISSPPAIYRLADEAPVHLGVESSN